MALRASRRSASQQALVMVETRSQSELGSSMRLLIGIGENLGYDERSRLEDGGPFGTFNGHSEEQLSCSEDGGGERGWGDDGAIARLACCCFTNEDFRYEPQVSSGEGGSARH